MENVLVTIFLSYKLGKLIEDISNKKITKQEQLDVVWNEIFDEAVEIEKNQIKKAFERGENTITLDAEEYYNETYLQ
jgi:hypothetical protein